MIWISITPDDIKPGYHIKFGYASNTIAIIKEDGTYCASGLTLKTSTLIANLKLWEKDNNLMALKSSMWDVEFQEKLGDLLND